MRTQDLSNEPVWTTYALNCLCQLVPYTYKFRFLFFGKIQVYLILYQIMFLIFIFFKKILNSTRIEKHVKNLQSNESLTSDNSCFQSKLGNVGNY